MWVSSPIGIYCNWASALQLVVHIKRGKFMKATSRRLCNKSWFLFGQTDRNRVKVRLKLNLRRFWNTLKAFHNEEEDCQRCGPYLKRSRYQVACYWKPREAREDSAKVKLSARTYCLNQGKSSEYQLLLNSLFLHLNHLSWSCLHTGNSCSVQTIRASL